MNREDLEQAYSVCHASCRRSKNVSPFAGCRCRCGGAGHASETLAAMTLPKRRAAEQQMRADAARGRENIGARLAIAREIKEFRRIWETEAAHTLRKLRRA